MPVFTCEERACLRSEFLERAAADPRITGAAITGSVASGHEDRWSDIDLAFGIVNDAAIPDVLTDWTEFMYARHAAIHHLDVTAGSWIYRVFLLPGTLQVDLAFVRDAEFGALAPSFQLVFGHAKEPRFLPPPALRDIAGFGWLYALHARSCIARGKLWQAEYMLSGMRDNALALACIRHDLPAVHGRGFDLLPEELLSHFESSLVRNLERTELMRAFLIVTECLSRELREADAELALRLEDALVEMPRSLH